MRVFKSLLIIGFTLLLSAVSKGQDVTSYFSTLSSEQYASRISAIKSRSIPVKYQDKKEQKTYADIIKDRNESIAKDLEKDRVVHDTMLLNRSYAILNRIKNANTAYDFDSIRIYINRSGVPNASCYGEGTLFINLGLFLLVDNDDELAMVIGHELSHQFLDHSENKIKKNITLFSSEDFIEEMRAIKKSKDGKYERYKNLMKEVVTENGKHSRYKESDADSLGVLLAKNAGYSIDKGASILLKLEKSDDLFIGKEVYDHKPFFQNTVAATIGGKKKYNGLSTVDVTMNADAALDTVRTHPDCISRYKKISGKTETFETGCCSKLSAQLVPVKERALVEMIRNAYQVKNYTLCIHYCLFALNNNFTSQLYNTFLSLSFSGIYAADRKLEKFSVTNTEAHAGSTLKKIQDMIFDMNGDQVKQVAEHFLNRIGPKESEEYLFALAAYNKATTDQETSIAYDEFKTRFPKSKYTTLINK